MCGPVDKLTDRQMDGQTKGDSDSQIDRNMNISKDRQTER